MSRAEGNTQRISSWVDWGAQAWETSQGAAGKRPTVQEVQQAHKNLLRGGGGDKKSGEGGQLHYSFGGSLGHLKVLGPLCSASKIQSWFESWQKRIWSLRYGG